MHRTATRKRVTETVNTLVGTAFINVNDVRPGVGSRIQREQLTLLFKKDGVVRVGKPNFHFGPGAGHCE
jgi:hypothetical protein